MKWRIENDNDTGSNDEYFVEWWNVTDGEKSFRCNTEADANFLLSVLTPPASDELKEDWVSVDEYNGEKGRLLVFSPIYKEDDPMRYRIIDSQFLNTCKDVTHYYLPKPPLSTHTSK